MRDIIFFGIQGCWKWTQAFKILELYKNEFSYLSTGDVFRALNSNNNAIGDYLKDKLNVWQLIPDEVTISIFNVYFQTILDSDKKMLLDGYPRTKTQIDNLLNLVEKEKRDIIGVYFDLSENIAIERMLSRGRDDDNLEAIRYRLKEYYEKTVPVVEYFASKWKLVNIDAGRPVDEIFEDLKLVV